MKALSTVKYFNFAAAIKADFISGPFGGSNFLRILDFRKKTTKNNNKKKKNRIKSTKKKKTKKKNAISYVAMCVLYMQVLHGDFQTFFHIAVLLVCEWMQIRCFII